jgi:hypothetical protein
MTDELFEHFRILERQGDADWDDVVHRARGDRVRHRATLVAVLAVVLAISAPTALAFRGSVVDFFKGDPAPPTVVKQFQRLEVGAPPGLENRIVYGETRKALDWKLDDGRVLTLWVAPNRHGGFCSALVGPRHPDGFGCLWGKALRSISPTIEVSGPISPEGVIHGGPVLVYGAVGEEGADLIELRYEDGDVESQRLTWVSKPIDAGFFLFDVPRLHWSSGHRWQRLVLRDDDRKAIGASETLRAPGR